MEANCKYCKHPHNSERTRLNLEDLKFGWWCFECQKWNLTWRGRLDNFYYSCLFWISILFLPGSKLWRGFWGYLFEKRANKEIPWRIVLWCRWRGHPSGVVWFTDTEATEPDMSCRNCGDEL